MASKSRREAVEYLKYLAFANETVNKAMRQILLAKNDGVFNLNKERKRDGHETFVGGRRHKTGGIGEKPA